MSKKTKKVSKKIKIIIGVLIIIVVGIIISLLLINKFKSKVIFINSHENYAWSPVSYGYKIYNNGIIEEYDEYDNEEELKRAKISNEELMKLKELADSVEADYTKKLNPQSILNPNSFAAAMEVMWDAGVTEKKIYNNKEDKWITLYQYGDTMGYNNTEETKEIIELTEQLYEKYLKDNK